MSETPKVENEATEAAEATEAIPATEAAAEAEATEAAEPAVEEVAAEAAEPAAEAAEPAAEAEEAAEVDDSEPTPYVEPNDDDEAPAETTLFNVSNRLEEKVIDGRLEAVSAAKEWSIESGQSIVVERTDGRVQMSFRDGALVDYVLETRKGRRA